jgi:hypothetical protein
VVHYFRIWEGENLPEIGRYRPFKCVVIVQSPPTSQWQKEVSEWLVANGCLAMSAWGVSCSTWDDSVDHANIDAWADGEIPDEHFVMTAWHENQPMSEALGFAKYAAFHPVVDLEKSRCLLFDIGPTDRESELVSEYDAAWDD